MRRPTLASLALLTAALGTGCDDPTATPPRPSFADQPIRGGGFDNANNVGSINGSQWAASPWQFPADIEVGFDVTDPNDVCFGLGRCAVGTIINPDFVDPNAFTLGAAVNPDPNPAEACVDVSQNPSVKCYALLSTTNFFEPATNGSVLITTLRSGIQATFPLGANTGWVLDFDYAFLTNPAVTPSSTDAYAVVLLTYDSDQDQIPDATFEAFRVTRSDVENGLVPVEPSGCGSLTLGGVASSYPLCTGWQNHTVDVTLLAGQTVTVQIYVDEGGIDAGVATSLAVDNLKFAETVLVGTVTGPTDPVEVNTPVTATATFTDTESGATHTATIDWGDGTVTPATVTEPVGATPGSVTGEHSYTTPGVYAVLVTISDGSGAPGQGRFEFIVAYDPLAGYVAGRGAIESPAGAYPADPSLAGRAVFGFGSRYERGKTVPSGDTHFAFHTAGLRFLSTSYEWLVIAGARAQYKGVGTVNGVGNFGFLLTAIDGEVNGGGGVDKFRLKIWDKDQADAIVYDNELGASDDVDPSTGLSEGSIVIHKQ